MQRILPLLFTLLFCTSVRAQKETAVTSTVSAVTVYLNGAQVSRTAKAAVAEGQNTLVFTGLTKDLDPASIQLKSGNDDFVVLSVSHRLNFNEPPAENPAADKIYAALEVLEKQKARLTVSYRITEEEDAILKLNRVVASPQTGLDAADLISAVNFHRERITAIKRRQLSITDSLAVIRDERLLLREQLSDLGLQRQTKATAEIVVVTQSERAVSDEFTLTYQVPNARWIPHYDARVADISQPVNLRYRAKVSQQTGEDWSNVRLKLSTGDPTANGVAPKLSVWRLTQNSRPPTFRPAPKRQVQNGLTRVQGQVIESSGEALIGATILVPGTEIGTVTDIDGRYDLEVPAGTTQLVVSYLGYNSQMVPFNSTRVVLKENEEMLEDVVVTAAGIGRERKKLQYKTGRAKKDRRHRQDAAAAPPPVIVQRQATTVSFDIELPYTIPSDGKARDVEIRRYDLPASYTHLAVPKFSSDAYLTAAVTDWEQYNLLSGAVNLFFEGTFLGTSALDVSTFSDTLEMSLGRDPNVLVERKATEDYRKRNFFGNKISESRGYTITARNKKQLPINLIILDQVPVSADEEIDVKVEHERSFNLNEKTGILTWRTKIGPGKMNQTEFGYTVKYPNYKPVTLE